MCQVLPQCFAGTLSLREEHPIITGNGFNECSFILQRKRIERCMVYQSGIR